MLQVSTVDDDLMMMRGVDLGFDSLLSVDVRSWFLKNFRVSIPVLKTMANDVHMSTLVELAAESIPAELVPQVQQVTVVQTGASTPHTEKSEPSAQTSNVDTTSTRATSPNTSGAVTPDKEVKAKLGNPPTVDWDFETTPPDPFTLDGIRDAPKPKGNPKVVVLTGCSGLLGHHLLNTLVAQPSIRKIICLAVRHLSSRLENGEIPAPSERIVYYEGDLTSTCFGLDVATWTSV
jgi:hypothetical protein